MPSANVFGGATSLLIGGKGVVCTFIHMLNTHSQYTHRYLGQDSSKPNKENHILTRKTHTQVHVDKTTVEQVRSQRKSPTVGAVPFPLKGDD